ncbi:hypothetical protein B7Z28_01245, partial [Candidatus Saccharibacteria bacterium 32-45-3]
LVNSKEPADIRHIHPAGWYCWKQLLLYSGKKIISAHIVPDSLVGSLRLASSWSGIASWYLKVFYNMADAVIAVSESTKEELLRIGVKKPIRVINNMIDTERYKQAADSRENARETIGIAQDAFVVVSNGQVQPRKRVDLFIKMAKDMPDGVFIWVGGIPFKGAAANYEQMKRLMKRAPKNVRFTKVIPLDQVKLYLHAADVFVMPSDQETFGLAIVEAAAAGLPVVLRDIHDYDQTFRGKALICQEQEFSEILKKLRSEPAFYAVAKAQSSEIAAQYDSETIAEQLVSLYAEISSQSSN